MESISCLTGLRKLNVSYNKYDLDPITKLTELKELKVSIDQNLDSILEFIITIKQNGGKVTITNNPNLFT